VTDADLKRVLLAQARARGEKPNPAALGKAAAGILATREIRTTLAAMTARGSEARYVAVDVTDSVALTTTLDGIRSEWGPVAAVVHGAGVLQDKLIVEKTPEQFNRVFDTKVGGLRALLDATAGDELKVLCLFSSVAARCGNPGQCDYAMANEVLNKVALSEARRRGPSCRVKAMGWGPWEGGMVTPQLKAHFASMGVPLIPLDVGARMLVDEFNSTQLTDIEMVLGGEPRPEALAPSSEAPGMVVEVVVDQQSHPYLQDHSVKGTPVVPVAFAIEWFSRAARAFKPELTLVGLEQIKVLRGISLRDFASGPKQIEVHCSQVSNGNGAVVALELKDASGALYYQATAQMSETRVPPALGAGIDLGLEAWGDRAVYDGKVLFHGPDFQMIHSIDGVSDHGMSAQMGGVVDAGWQDAWFTDPVAMDGGLQLAVLWCNHMLGGASLPTGIEAVRTFGDLPITGPLRGTLTGRRARDSRTVVDVVLHDASGTVVAELQGIENHLLPKA